ncbi:MAG: hypothetical protein WCO84_05610 [bacterium]
MNIFEAVREVMDKYGWVGLTKMIEDFDNYDPIVCFLSVFLSGKKKKTSFSELFDLALERFCKMDNYREHEKWTYALCHFTKGLWKWGMMDWVKRLNNQALENAEKTGKFNHCDRLLKDLLWYGNFATNPAELGMTEKYIGLINKGNIHQFILDKISALPFASQELADIWEANWHLTDPMKRCRKSVCDAQETLISAEMVEKYVEVLRKAGQDVRRFEGLSEKLCKDELAKFEIISGGELMVWKRARVNAAIKFSRDQLKKLAKLHKVSGS